MPDEEYVPATRVVPDPMEGWSGADLSDDELVDDEFIVANAARVYDPLMPEDEKRFKVFEVEGRMVSFEMETD